MANASTLCESMFLSDFEKPTSTLLCILPHPSSARVSRVIVKPGDIKEEVATFFENLYKRENFLWPKLDGVPFPSVSKETQRWLEREFEVEEVKWKVSHVW